MTTRYAVYYCPDNTTETQISIPVTSDIDTTIARVFTAIEQSTFATPNAAKAAIYTDAGTRQTDPEDYRVLAYSDTTDPTLVDIDLTPPAPQKLSHPIDADD